MLNPLSSFILPVWSTKLVSSVKELELELLEDELLGLLLEVLELVVELELLLDVGLLLEEVDEGLLFDEELELLLEDVFRNAPCSAGAQPTTIETSSKIAEKIAIIFTFIFPSLY